MNLSSFLLAVKPRMEGKMSKDKFKFKLGAKVIDKITGFSGVVVCQTKWLNNCSTYGIQPIELKDGVIQEKQHLDEPQLELIEETKIKPKDDTGGPERPINRKSKF